MQQDLIALLAAFLYVGAVVAIGEGATRLGVAREISRKIIHVGVGFWIFGTIWLFERPWVAVIPPLVSALGNWVIHRKRLLKSVETVPENLGTVWYPISFAILILLAWDRPAAVVGGVMAMTLGDALAATVGVRWGRRQYRTLGGAVKSLEGSVAMFLGAFAATVLLVPPLPWASAALHDALGASPGASTAAGIGAFGPWAVRLAQAALAGVVGMCAEGLGVKGRDNLWVPLGVGAVLYWAADPSVPPAVVVGVGAGAFLAACIGVGAWLKGALTPSGVLGAVLTGTLVFGFGGWTGGLALVGFFVSSSLLSRLFRHRKRAVEREYAKTGTRDLGQALANGGVAAVAALLLGVTGDMRFLGALVGALAAANADTWATELGVLAPSPPRLITTLRTVVPGTSGAVSLTGTLAAAGGAAFVGLVAALVQSGAWEWLPWMVLAGLAGAFLDSLLGATVQGVYYCPDCGRETEQQRHHCGAVTRLRRGAAWLGNDLVNLLATLAGGVVGFLAV